MQIGRAKIAYCRKRLPVLDLDCALVARYEALFVQRLKRAVHVNRGKPCRVTNLLLCHWQFVAVSRHHPRRLKSYRNLAQKVGDARSRVTTPNICDPLPKDRALDQRLKPHGAADCRMRKGKVLDSFCCHVRYVSGSQHLDAVIRDTEESVLEIKHISGYVY